LMQQADNSTTSMNSTTTAPLNKTEIAQCEWIGEPNKHVGSKLIYFFILFKISISGENNGHLRNRDSSQCRTLQS
jgi:hypothetical protein